jgi:hypothetical protein
MTKPSTLQAIREISSHWKLADCDRKKRGGAMKAHRGPNAVRM